MEGISDIKIIGIDKKRPPLIRKAPYIDLFFELSHQAPADWCREFNELMAQHLAKPKIMEKEGKYIIAWVRTPDEIVSFVELLKENVSECTRQYIERIEVATRQSSNSGDNQLAETGEQGRLNRIIASLVFDKGD